MTLWQRRDVVTGFKKRGALALAMGAAMAPPPVIPPFWPAVNVNRVAVRTVDMDRCHSMTLFQPTPQDRSLRRFPLLSHSSATFLWSSRVCCSIIKGRLYLIGALLDGLTTAPQGVLGIHYTCYVIVIVRLMGFQ